MSEISDSDDDMYLNRVHEKIATTRDEQKGGVSQESLEDSDDSDSSDDDHDNIGQSLSLSITPVASEIDSVREGSSEEGDDDVERQSVDDQATISESEHRGDHENYTYYENSENDTERNDRDSESEEEFVDRYEQVNVAENNNDYVDDNRISDAEEDDDNDDNYDENEPGENSDVNAEDGETLDAESRGDSDKDISDNTNADDSDDGSSKNSETQRKRKAKDTEKPKKKARTGNENAAQTTNYLTEEIEERFLECALCHDTYNDPRVLLCLHSFCRSCLEQYAASCREFGKIKKLSCPLCRTNYDLSSRKGIDGIPKDFFKSELVQFMDEKKEPLVQEECPESTFCDIHKQEVARYYCVDCAKLVCAECVIFSEHKLHKVQKSADFVAELDGSVEKVLELLEKTGELSRNMRNTFAKVKEENRGKKLAVRRSVENEAEILHGLVDEEKGKLLDNIESLFAKLDALNQPSKRARKLLKKLEDVNEECARCKTTTSLEEKINLLKLVKEKIMEIGLDGVCDMLAVKNIATVEFKSGEVNLPKNLFGNLMDLTIVTAFENADKSKYENSRKGEEIEGSIPVL